MGIVECELGGGLKGTLTRVYKCILVAGILSGGDPSSTFTQAMGDSGNLHKTRAYMVFILAFVAIMSIVVGVFELIWNAE